MDWLTHFFHEFVHLFFMVLPYFILGITAGAIIESKTNIDVIYSWLGKGRLSIILGSLLGAILPGCACATMPMAEGLIRKGAKLSTTCAFIMTSPLLAPQTIILTYALLGPQFTIGRVLFSLVGGIGFGLIIHALESKNHLQLSTTSSSNQCCNANQSPAFFSSMISIGKKLGGYFIIGLAIASTLSATIPTDLIPKTIGDHPLLSYGIATIIGIPIYICEGEEIPITYSLLSLGLAAGPSFTFLLGAVGTCIPTLLFAQKILGKKPMVIYALYWLIFAPISGLIFSKLFHIHP